MIKQQEVTFRNKTKRTSEARSLSYSRIFLSLPGDKLNGKNGTLCPSVLNSTDRITLFAKKFRTILISGKKVSENETVRNFYASEILSVRNV